MAVNRVSISILSGLLLATTAAAANASGAIFYHHAEKATISGHKIRLMDGLEVNANCVAAEAPAFKIVLPPTHGQLSKTKEMIFPSYRPPSPAVKCNTRKFPAVLMYYKPAPGFIGQDFVELRVAYTSGQLADIKFDIDVK